MKERYTMISSRIFIDGKDKTEQIEKIEELDTEYLVKYKKSDKFYHFKKEKNRLEIKLIDENVVELFNVFAQIASSIKIDGKSSSIGRYYGNITLENNSILFKYLSGEIYNKFNDDKPLIFPFKFNKSQLNATKKVFENEMSIIQGPPGTGKTQTILNIIANILIRGENVAVVSNNNAAVDNIREKLVENGYSYIFALLGNKETQKNFFNNQDQKSFIKAKVRELDIEKLKNDLIKSTKTLKVLMEKDRKKKIIAEELSALKLEKAYYESTHTIPNFDNKNISFIKLGHEKIINFLVDHRIMITENEKLTFKNKFGLIVKYGIYKFKDLRENEYDIITHFQTLYYDFKIKDLEKKLKECTTLLKNQNFDKMLKEHHKLSQEVFNHYLYQTFKKKKRYEMTTYKNNFKSFIKDYPVILSTAYSVTNSIERNFKFDYVIVDEASTLDIVKAVLPMSCAKKMVIVGDQKQLPHIPEKIDVKIMNEAYDYKNKNIMDSLDYLYGNNLERTLLQEHYRCHPDIIRFCNMKYYGGELIVYTECSNNDPITVVETAKGNHMREIRGYEKGTINQRELEELNKLIESKSNYKISFYSKDVADIGLVAPFRLQIEYSERINPNKIEKDTVHKYQGRQKPIMVFSTVLDESFKSNKKMSFVTDSKLVNVAVSRAEHQLILISNINAFYKNGNDIGDLIKYIKYHDIKNIKKGRVISVFDLLYKEYSGKLLTRKKALLKVKKNIKYESEKIIYSILEELFEETVFNCYLFSHEVRLADIFLDQVRCNDVERNFIRQPRSSVDFIISNKFDNNPVMAIEVDGTQFHLNNKAQLERDKKKDTIFAKYNIPLLRLPTHKAITKGMIKIELLKLTETK